MLTLDALWSRIADYRRGSISFDDFEDWFRDNSRALYGGSNQDLSAAIVAVESALSKYRFGGIDERRLAEELDTAIRSFVAIKL